MKIIITNYTEYNSSYLLIVCVSPNKDKFKSVMSEKTFLGVTYEEHGNLTLIEKNNSVYLNVSIKMMLNCVMYLVL